MYFNISNKAMGPQELATPQTKTPAFDTFKKRTKTYLVGGWTNPFEKYDRQIGSFP